MHGTLCIADAVNWGHSLNRGLVSWWLALPGMQRGVVMRDIARRNHGTLVGGPLLETRPDGFGSVFFDGTDDRVDLVSAPSVANGVTYTAWIRPSTVAASNYAIRSNKKTIFATTGASLRWWADSDLANVDDNVFTLAVDEWRFVGVTQVGTTYAFYVDGKPGRTGTTSALDDAADKANIGSFATAFLWNGGLADVRDYNRALSATEMRALYRQARAGYPDLLNWHPYRWPSIQEAAAGGTILPQMMAHYWGSPA